MKGLWDSYATRIRFGIGMYAAYAALVHLVLGIDAVRMSFASGSEEFRRSLALMSERGSISLWTGVIGQLGFSIYFALALLLPLGKSSTADIPTASPAQPFGETGWNEFKPVVRGLMTPIATWLIFWAVSAAWASVIYARYVALTAHVGSSFEPPLDQTLYPRLLRELGTILFCGMAAWVLLANREKRGANNDERAVDATG
ncbi:MAG: hypothetical protein HYR64_03705 [Fimbriimonas ginsengisoli]|uniref:Uncharacterized protein n=1 Tax=Fimbriimonas ginsengisoli TaxID=1005039 RepID=A0A931PTB7_FIMGI|nr:hypothetical protein [Fimbriimonas ginsengisoli]